MNKKSLLMLVLILLIFSVSVAAETIYVEDRLIRPAVDPQVIQGRLHLALYDITDYLGIRFSWQWTGNHVRVSLDRKVVTVENPTIINGYLMVDLDFLRRELDLYVEWDQRAGRVYIYQRQPISTPKVDKGLFFGVESDRQTYTIGDPIAVSIVLVNLSSDSARIEFATSQTFELILWRGTREVWRYSQDRAFLQALRTMELHPFEVRNYAVIIPTNKIAGLLSGDYRIEAYMATRDDRVLLTDMITVTLRR